jgi:hemerythrin superfamily protein
MNATQLLKKDHTTVKALFKEFEKAGDRAYQKKQGLFAEIKGELEVHMKVEEEIFYPAVKRSPSEELKEAVSKLIWIRKIGHRDSV